jgi:hypothetical protein
MGVRSTTAAELYRISGEIALNSPGQDAAKAEDYFERALAIARQQQAKSWELRAVRCSIARLWRECALPPDAPAEAAAARTGTYG